MRKIATLLAVIAAIAFASPVDAQISLLQCTAQNELTSISPGATCTYGGLRHVCQPLLGSVTNTDFCFPGNTGPTGATGTTGATGSTGATGAAGQDASGVRWRDANGVLVDDVYAFASRTSNDGQPRYWTGDAFWPVFSASGLSTLEAASATLLYYQNSSCTGTPVIGMDGFRQNEVFPAYTSIAQVSLEQWAPFRPGPVATPANCWIKDASDVCTALSSCYWATMAEALSAGSAPDLSGYEMPMHEVAAP